RVDSPYPVVPFDTGRVRRLWHISPEWRLGSTAAIDPIPGMTDESPRLPLPDFRAFFGPWATTPKPGRGSPPHRPMGVLRAFDHSSGDQRGVVDTAATSAVGVQPSDSIAAANLGEMLRARGLVVAPFDAGQLLTRSDDVKEWAAGADWDGRFPRGVAT